MSKYTTEFGTSTAYWMYMTLPYNALARLSPAWNSYTIAYFVDLIEKVCDKVP